jgi:hypothetical protein
MKTLLLLLMFLPTYALPVRVPAPDGSNGPDHWYRCAQGTLGYWVDDDPTKKEVLSKHFVAHRRQVYSENDPSERQVRHDHWICQVGK